MWSLAFTIYFVLGIIVVLVTPARHGFIASLEEEDLENVPVWKKLAFLTILCTGALILWPFFLPSWLHKKKSLWDKLQGNPIFQEQKALFEMMSAMCEDGCETDVIPEGHGEFGHDITNPIPTRTVFGSNSYLARLRSSDGAKVIYNRQGSFSSPVSSHPIDGYEISHPNGRQLAVLYLSPYHKRSSEKAPRGFRLPEATLA